MKLRPFAAALIALLLLPAAGPAEVRPTPDGGVATCLRSSGPGEVTALDAWSRRGSRYGVFATSGTSLSLTRSVALGTLRDCAESASAGDTAVVAGFVGNSDDETGRVLTAALRRGAEPFGPAVALHRVRADAKPAISVAVGPAGDAVIAWAETVRRFPRSDNPAAEEDTVRSRLLMVRSAPGGDFGRVEELVPWRSGDGFADLANVAAGVDDSGNTTVVASLPAPAGRTISSLSDVVAVTAGRGAPAARPQTILRRAQEVARIRVAVADGGRALTTWSGNEVISYAERGAAGAAFGPVAIVTELPEAYSPREPDVALRGDGAAVLAWRFWDNDDRRDGVMAVRRASAGRFGAPELLHRDAPRAKDPTSVSVFGLFEGPPVDTGPLRVVLDERGSALVTWTQPRPIGEDLLASAYAVRGTVAGGWAAAEVVSGDCRPVNNAVPVTAVADQPPTAVWADNDALAIAPDFDFPTGGGQLHVGPDPDSGAAAPSTEVRTPRRVQELYFDDPVRFEVDCDGPCEARAFAPGRYDTPLAAETVSRRNAGRVRFALRGPLSRHLVPAHGRGLDIELRTCAPDGASATRRVGIPARRKPVPPLPQPLDVTAVRDGDDIVVRWRTEERALRAAFSVSGYRRGGTDAVAVAAADGRGRRRFAVRLEGPRSVARVEVEARGIDPPFRNRSRTASADVRP